MRKKFLYSQFVLFHLLRRRGHACNPENFTMLKTKSGKKAHNNICKLVFEDLVGNSKEYNIIPEYYHNDNIITYRLQTIITTSPNLFYYFFEFSSSFFNANCWKILITFSSSLLIIFYPLLPIFWLNSSFFHSSFTPFVEQIPNSIHFITS